jgi:hypothetical protein
MSSTKGLSEGENCGVSVSINALKLGFFVPWCDNEIIKVFLGYRFLAHIKNIIFCKFEAA